MSKGRDTLILFLTQRICPSVVILQCLFIVLFYVSIFCLLSVFSNGNFTHCDDMRCWVVLHVTLY